MKREMWPGEKKKSGMNYDKTFSVSPLFLFSLKTRVYTHSLTHTQTNNNSKESVNSRLSLLSLRWGTNHTRHRGWGCLLWWFSKVKLPQVLSAPPGRQPECLMRLFLVSVGGKGTTLLLSLKRFFFFQAEEKRRIKLDTPWSFFSPMCQCE